MFQTVIFWNNVQLAQILFEVVPKQNKKANKFEVDILYCELLSQLFYI